MLLLTVIYAQGTLTCAVEYTCRDKSQILISDYFLRKKHNE